MCGGKKDVTERPQGSHEPTGQAALATPGAAPVSSASTTVGEAQPSWNECTVQSWPPKATGPVRLTLAPAQIDSILVAARWERDMSSTEWAYWRALPSDIAAQLEAAYIQHDAAHAARSAPIVVRCTTSTRLNDDPEGTQLSYVIDPLRGMHEVRVVQGRIERRSVRRIALMSRGRGMDHVEASFAHEQHGVRWETPVRDVLQKWRWTAYCPRDAHRLETAFQEFSRDHDVVVSLEMKRDAAFCPLFDYVFTFKRESNSSGPSPATYTMIQTNISTQQRRPVRRVPQITPENEAFDPAKEGAQYMLASSAPAAQRRGATGSGGRP